MSLFNRLRRSSTAADHYASQAASYAASSFSNRHTSFQRQRKESDEQMPQVSFETDLYVPSDVGVRGPASEISLRSEYNQLDDDTSRYPKLTRTLSGSSNTRKTSSAAPEEIRVNPAVESSNGTTATAARQAIPPVEQEAILAPMLTVSSLGIKWDVRNPPAHLRQMRGNTRVSNGLAAAALSTKKSVLCIISYDFPWTLAISTQDGRALTVMDILEALYQSLHKEVRRSEWALAPDVQRYIMLKANKTRRNSNMAMGIRRVDWLGTRCMFRGLEKDDDLARRRLMPGDQPKEVWVARFGSIHL